MSKQIPSDEASTQPKKRRRWVRVMIGILATVGGLICLAIVAVVGGVGYFIWDFASGPGQAGRALLTAIAEDDYTEALLHVGSQYGDSPEAFEQHMAELGMDEIDRIISVQTIGASEAGNGWAEAFVVMGDGTERRIVLDTNYSGSVPGNWIITRMEFRDE